MRERIQAVVEELQRLKREGQSSVAVSDDAIAKLRRAVVRERDETEDRVEARTFASGPTRVEPAVQERAPAHADSTGPAAASGFQALIEASERDASSASMSAARAAKAPPSLKSTLPPPPEIRLPKGSKRERWEWLRDRVLNCETCRAHTPEGFKVVFGVGSIDADIFFCGEAPGADEEIQGEPFVGAAGKLLTKMIIAMGLQREQVYIGNILNWRPQKEERSLGTSTRQSGNRPPTEEEMRFGLPYLLAQVEVVQPKVIIALGKTAAEGLLGFGSFKNLGSIRGKWQDFNGTPLMVTYHPSYLLQYASPKTKRVVWEDLLAVMQKTGLPISEKQRAFFA